MASPHSSADNENSTVTKTLRNAPLRSSSTILIMPSTSKSFHVDNVQTAIKKKIKKKRTRLDDYDVELAAKKQKIQKISEDISKALNILTSATGKTVAKASANLFSANSSVKGICSSKLSFFFFFCRQRLNFFSLFPTRSFLCVNIFWQIFRSLLLSHISRISHISLSLIFSLLSVGSPSKSNTLVLKFQFVVTLATKTSAEKN